MGRWVRCMMACGLAWSVLGVVLASAEPLRNAFEIPDPAAKLTPAQRSAARALGEASRFASAGETARARAALERVAGARALAGYAELVRVHVLMKEGRPAEAHRHAGAAREASSNAALRAALGVLQGEALAMSGDTPGAELAWRSALETSAAEDEAVRNSIGLAIVASRQRTGSLNPSVDPLVLLDREFEDVVVSTPEVPIAALSPQLALTRATEAFEAGRTERSIELFDRAIAGSLDAEQARRARMGRAHALFRARRYEAAAGAFGALLPDVEARFWRARSLARLGRVEASIEEFKRVTRDDDADFASWSLFLMGTLYEDREELGKAIDVYRRAAEYEQFPKRMRAALWREGWAQFRSGAHAEARTTLLDLVGHLDEPVDQLRPRYWAARAAWLAGDARSGRGELESIAGAFPLTYYGWRAQERLALGQEALVQTDRDLSEGTRRIDDQAIERITLLLEANLQDLARDELRFAAGRARGFADRVSVGVLLTRVGDYHRANRLVVDAYADSLARGLQSGREALWWLSWPPAYREMIDEALAADTGVDPALVWAIMREESHYRADARSVVGALGLLQLMPSTAEQLAADRGLVAFQAEDLFDPKTNITLGSTYLSQLGRRFDGRVSAAIGSYNAGPSKVATWLEGDQGRLEDDVWVESIPYDQTRGYVKRVLRSLYVYKAFYSAN